MRFLEYINFVLLFSFEVWLHHSTTLSPTLLLLIISKLLEKCMQKCLQQEHSQFLIISGVSVIKRKIHNRALLIAVDNNIQVLNRTEMVPRGPSFGIGSAHAQNAPANRKTRPPHPRSRLHSAPSRELAL